MTSRTPIKIRGKKQTAGSRCSQKPVPNQQKYTRSTILPDSILPRPRAKKRRQSAIDGEATIAIQNIPSSRLESLPTELLEIIFFQCLNLNLPQASPALYHKLTSQHVKSQLLIEICSSKTSTRSVSLLEAIFPRLEDQAELQTAVLQTKWMTLDFIRALVPSFLVATLVRELGARKLRWMGDGPIVSKGSEPVIREYIDHNLWRLECYDYPELPAYWEVWWPTDVEDDLVCVGIGLGDGLVTIWKTYDLDYFEGVEPTDYDDKPEPPWSKWRLLSCAEGCRIPVRLLHGPWNSEKCALLECLVRGNATVDWIGTTDGEVAKQGLLEAIRGDNVRATLALLERDGYITPMDCYPVEFFDEFSFDDTLSDDEADLPCKLSAYRDIPVRKGVGVPVTTEHMRIAILEKGCQRKLVSDLLYYAGFCRCVIDDEIHEWAITNSNKMNDDAIWLLEQKEYQEQLVLKDQQGSRRSDRLFWKDRFKD